MTDQPAFDLQASMDKLEEIVRTLEAGNDLALSEALKSFEHGLALSKACSAALNEAQQKVEQLVGGVDGRTEPFHPK